MQLAIGEGKVGQVVILAGNGLNRDEIERQIRGALKEHGDDTLMGFVVLPLLALPGLFDMIKRGINRANMEALSEMLGGVKDKVVRVDSEPQDCDCDKCRAHHARSRKHN